MASPSQGSVRWAGNGEWNREPGYTYTITVVDNGLCGARRCDTIDVTIHRTGESTAVVLTFDGAQRR